MSNPLRIIYAGTPEFSVAALQALIESSYDVVAVYTQPDRPAGRGRGLQASPVKEKALQYNIPVYQPKSLKDEKVQRELKALDADLMIVTAYGLFCRLLCLQHLVWVVLISMPHYCRAGGARHLYSVPY